MTRRDLAARAVGVLRASRWWPARLPDKRADEARVGVRIESSIIVFFATGADTLYQLRPWLDVLALVHERFGLTLVFRDSRTASLVGSDTGLDCLTLATYGQLDTVLQASDVKLALYVNNHPSNFECLRFASLTHVHLGHGDSDKRVTVSNQMKAYDYCLLPGQAALDRVRSGLMDYDADAHSILIGSPCLPTVPPRPPGRTPRVLYAPTWESSQPSVSYGSVVTRGHQIMDALAGFDVVYRPHPLSGTIDPDYARVDRELRGRAVRVDVGVPLERSFADADVLICDVSAVAVAWLATRRPLVLVASDAAAAPSPMARRVPVLGPSDDVRATIIAALEAPPLDDELVTYYLGETDPERARARLLDVFDGLIGRRDQAWAMLVEGGLSGP